MALLHKTEIRPGKLELLSTWLPTRTWYDGPPEPSLDRVGAARFDDPAGEVGLEIMLVRAGDGPVLHVPLTYRGAPLDGGEEFLVGTMEHGVLGTRWVYDAAGDPVFTEVLAGVIRDGGEQAVEEVHGDGEVVVREPHLLLRGSGSAASPAADPGTDDVTRINVADGALWLFRTPESAAAPESSEASGDAVLTASWSGLDAPIVLARLTA
ncbi:CG0192-related protein [Actinoplanes sp. HUAS TT8]|uniref:CG0192-related protein n=1 Tax=Actinoplanes sp. HUAS TT8 TaxID=3447453 RepID=UPI003F5239FE